MDLTVLDLSEDSVAVSFATRVLADLGARVVKVERSPAGDPLRHRAPTVALPGMGEVGAAFLWTGRGKNSFGATPERGTAVVADLAAHADVVVSSSGAPPLGRRGAVVVTPFGSPDGGGEMAGWTASGAGLFHAGGLGIVTPRAPQDGAAGTVPPTAPAGHVAEMFGGLWVACAVLALRRGDRPVVVDLSLQECLLPLVRRELAAWREEGYIASRHERLWKVAPSGFYDTADGPVYVSVIENRQWAALCRLAGREDALDDERLATPESRFAHIEATDAVIRPWLASQTRDEVFVACGQARVPVGPVLAPHEVAASDHLQTRNGVARLTPALAFPALPLRALATDRDWTPASPGADTRRLLEELGWSPERVDTAVAAGAVFEGRR